MAINEENKIEEKTKSISFVEQLVEEDLKEGKNAGRIRCSRKIQGCLQPQI